MILLWDIYRNFLFNYTTNYSAPAGFVPLASDCEEELSDCCIS